VSQLGAFLLPLLPLLLLVVALLLGRYPGCEAVVRLAEHIAARSGTGPGTGNRRLRPHRPRSFAPGGGLLMALSLSGRAPPA
jgi:hypothetical protein